MGAILKDLRYGVRTLVRRPGLTAAMILMTALGIGANTAVFSVINSLLLRPLPYQGADRLVMVWETQPTLAKAPVASANFYDWREQAQTFEHIAAFRNQSFNLAGGDAPERIRGMRVAPEFFQVLGIHPVAGRVFVPEDDQPGRTPVIVISEALWRRRLGSDPKVLGQPLQLNGMSYTVIGVVPTPTSFPLNNAQVWTPFALKPNEKSRETHSLSVIARLKPGATIEQARSEMEGIASRLQEQYPGPNRGVGVKLVPLNEEVVGDVRPILLILLGAVGLVLLIACANVANLLLARVNVRQREIAVRTALGASPVRIVRQLLTESLLLAILGGALGLLLAKLGLDLLVALKPSNLPRLTEIAMDLRVLIFALAASVLSGVIFGLIPARESCRLDLIESLKEGKGKSSSGGRRRQLVRHALVIAQISFSLALMIGAGLMVKSFQRLQKVDPGFNPENVLAMDIILPPAKYTDGQKQAGFFQEVIGRVKTLPGVQSVGVITTPPLSAGSSTSFDVEGRTVPAQETRPLTEYRLTSEDYFRALRIPLMRGRYFTEQDTKEAAPVVIVNETLARKFFPGEDPVGRRIGLSGPPDWREIVGVVQDVRDYGLDNEARPTSYIPFRQNAPGYLAAVAPGMTLVIHSPTGPESLAPAVSSQVRAMDPDQAVSNIRTMGQALADSVAQRRFNMLLLTIFAGLALLLAVAGVYSVIAYLVTQRTQEFGIRLALGAQPGDILRLVVRQGLISVLVGTILGLILALALTRVLEKLLYGVSATDPLTFVIIPLLFILVGLAASYFPARRAIRIDPLVALRHE
jgi:putative ABC transport system permease protein